VLVRASSVLALISVIAAPLAAAAHSWSEATLIGTIVPGTVRCKDGDCAVTVRAERVNGRGLNLGDVDVSFKASTRLVDRERNEPWSDLETGLRASAGARVRLLGDLDHLDDRYVLMHTRRAVRMRAVQPSAPRAALFPACGQPPWSQATLERCSATGPRTRKVTVNATLESDATDHVLEVESVSVEDGGVALEPPAPFDTVSVPVGTRFVNPKWPRLLLSALRAGDRIAIGGVYELPLPQKADKQPGLHCNDAACEPRFVANEITLVAASR
jgi:hypothetical protein